MGHAYYKTDLVKSIEHWTIDEAGDLILRRIKYTQGARFGMNPETIRGTLRQPGGMYRSGASHFILSHLLASKPMEALLYHHDEIDHTLKSWGITVSAWFARCEKDNASRRTHSMSRQGAPFQFTHAGVLAGYRDDFYTAANIIGSTNAEGQAPTVYFATGGRVQVGGERGRITQTHEVLSNVGRSLVVPISSQYRMQNVGIYLVEKDENGVHFSRGSFIPVTEKNRPLLATAIIRHPFLKVRSEELWEP